MRPALIFHQANSVAWRARTAGQSDVLRLAPFIGTAPTGKHAAWLGTGIYTVIGRWQSGDRSKSF